MYIKFDPENDKVAIVHLLKEDTYTLVTYRSGEDPTPAYEPQDVEVIHLVPEREPGA